MYGTFPDAYLLMGDYSSNVIRSSGISRTSMIVIIPLFYLILIDKIKFFYLIPYSKLVYLIPYIIISVMIYLCQSRIVIPFFVLFLFFSVFYFLWDKTIKYKIQKFFILIMLPIIFFNSLIVIKKEINKISLGHENADHEYQVIRKTDKTTIMTGANDPTLCASASSK